MDIEWCPVSCLACDRQVDGGTYCSQCQRLFATSDSGSSGQQSVTPRFTGLPTYHSPTRGFFLPPAFDFSRYRRSNPVWTRAAVRAARRLPASESNDRKLPKEKAYLSTEERDLLGGYAYSFDLNRRWRRKVLSR